MGVVWGRTALAQVVTEGSYLSVLQSVSGWCSGGRRRGRRRCGRRWRSPRGCAEARGWLLSLLPQGPLRKEAVRLLPPPTNHGGAAEQEGRVPRGVMGASPGTGDIQGWTGIMRFGTGVHAQSREVSGMLCRHVACRSVQYMMRCDNGEFNHVPTRTGVGRPGCRGGMGVYRDVQE